MRLPTGVHGSQYEGMGEELFAAHSVFREALERCDGVLSIGHGFARPVEQKQRLAGPDASDPFFAKHWRRARTSPPWTRIRKSDVRIPPGSAAVGRDEQDVRALVLHRCSPNDVPQAY